MFLRIGKSSVLILKLNLRLRKELKMADSLAPLKTSFNIASMNIADNNSPYVVVAKTGTTVTPYPFERLKFEANRNARFAILTQDVAIVKRHYSEELGYVLSDGKNDRFFDKSPSVLYVYPIVHYIDCNDKGRPMSNRIQVKMLQCNKDMYNYLINILEIKGDITQFDFMGTQVPGGDRFPKYQLMEAGNAIWKTDPDLVSYVTDYLAQHGKNLLSSVGKIYSEEKLEELLGNGSSPTSVKEVNEQDLDDIFKPV